MELRKVGLATVRLQSFVVAMTKSFVSLTNGTLKRRDVLLSVAVVALAPMDKQNVEPRMDMRAIVLVYAAKNKRVLIGTLMNLLLVLAGTRLVQLASHLMFLKEKQCQ